MIDRETLLNSIGEFTWLFSYQFFIQTKHGCFIWNDPDYDGDNTIVPYKGNWKDFCKGKGSLVGRSKGKHTIKDYCGSDIVLAAAANRTSRKPQKKETMNKLLADGLKNWQAKHGDKLPKKKQPEVVYLPDPGHSDWSSSEERTLVIHGDEDCLS